MTPQINKIGERYNDAPDDIGNKVKCAVMELTAEERNELLSYLMGKVQNDYELPENKYWKNLIKQNTAKTNVNTP